MKIIDAMKNCDTDIRVVHRGRWLVWDSYNTRWEVWERTRYARSSRIVIATQDEAEAVEALIGDE